MYKEACHFRVGLRIILVSLVLLLVPNVAGADRIDSLKLPESLADVPTDREQANLIDPEPRNGSWAIPDHRPLGIHLENYDLTQEQINAARETGCGIVRLVLPMERFIAEAEPDWAVLDRVVSRLNRAGFEVLPVLTARSVVPEYYREFCEAVAIRYGGTFRYYQLLDNINLLPGLYTRDYADLLRRARLAITLVDPGAEIVCGGIRGVDLTYLDLLEEQGALDSIDILAFNVFPALGGIDDYDRRIRTDHSIPYFSSVTDWAWQRGKRVWVTSFGVSTSFTDDGVDQIDQASAYTRGALWLGWRGVERVIFSAVQDSDPTYTMPARCCGLLDVAGQPKASFVALKALNEEVRNAYHINPPFNYEGLTYQKPDATELLSAPLEDIPDYDPIADYRIYGMTIYGFWFYEPDLEEYRLIYWLDRDLAYDVMVTIGVNHGGLTPQDAYILLDEKSTRIEANSVWNMTYVPYQPISTVPGVLRFKVNENGRSG